MDSYPSSEEMVRQARREIDGPDAAPGTKPPEPAAAVDDAPVAATRFEPAPPPADPFSPGPDPFGTVAAPPPPSPPADEPYDPERAPATGDDRHVDWTPTEENRAAGPERVGRLLAGVRPLIGIVVLVVFAAATFFVKGSTSVAELEVGDCFDDPGPDVELVADVDLVDCAEPHDYEVLAQPVRAADLEYPGQLAMFLWADEQCLDRFEAYVGSPYSESAVYLTSMIPTPESWEQGDRQATCLIYQVDAAEEIIPTTGSLRNSGL